MDTELYLLRHSWAEDRTYGNLIIPGTPRLISTLEDKDRDLFASNPQDCAVRKIAKQTAIPYGRYQVIMSFSNRFQRYLPELLNVPAFTAIRIHGGETPGDTEGCPLVGLTWTRNKADELNQCKEAVEIVIGFLNQATTKSKVFINVIKP